MTRDDQIHEVDARFILVEFPLHRMQFKQLEIETAYQPRSQGFMISAPVALQSRTQNNACSRVRVGIGSGETE